MLCGVIPPQECRVSLAKSRHQTAINAGTRAENRVTVGDGGKAVPRHVGCIRPQSSKRENQIVSFYGLPLKFGTLDPPMAVILLPTPVYFWMSPTLLRMFATPAQVCLLFTLPVSTNSKIRPFRPLKPPAVPQLSALRCRGGCKSVNYF